MRSNPAHHHFFIFEPENILGFTLIFSTSYGRLTDLKSLLGLLLVSFIWLGQKISLKYLFLGGRGGDVCSPMSGRCRHRFCQNWLNLNPEKEHGPEYYWRNVSSQTIKELYKIFWEDFLMFDYSPDSVLQFVEAGVKDKKSATEKSKEKSKKMMQSHREEQQLKHDFLVFFVIFLYRDIQI